MASSEIEIAQGRVIVRARADPAELAETAEAMRYLEDGHARGKVVVAVSQ